MTARPDRDTDPATSDHFIPADEITARLPPPQSSPDRRLHRDICDELLDHLGCAAAREAASGYDAATIRRRVLARFGSPAGIALRLWLDATKGRLRMQRFTLGAAVTSVVLSLIAVGAIAALFLQQSTLLATVAQNAATLEYVAQRLPDRAAAPVAAASLQPTERPAPETNVPPVSPLAPPVAADVDAGADAQFPVAIICRTADGEPRPFHVTVRESVEPPEVSDESPWDSWFLFDGDYQSFYQSSEQGMLVIPFDERGTHDLVLVTEAGYATRQTIEVYPNSDSLSLEFVVPTGVGQLNLTHDFNDFEPPLGQENEQLVLSLHLISEPMPVNQDGVPTDVATGRFWVFLGHEQERFVADPLSGNELPALLLVGGFDRPILHPYANSRSTGLCTPVDEIELPVGNYRAGVSLGTTTWTDSSSWRLEFWDEWTSESRYFDVHSDDLDPANRDLVFDLYGELETDLGIGGWRSKLPLNRFEIRENQTASVDFSLPEGFTPEVVLPPDEDSRSFQAEQAVTKK